MQLYREVKHRICNWQLAQVLLVMLLMIAACARHVPTTSALPAGWPVPALTLPPQSRVINSRMQGSDQWFVMFTCSQGYPAAKQHVESCLRGLGYRKPLANAQFIEEGYISSDGMMMVLLSELPKTRTGVGCGSAQPMYSVSIKQFSRPVKTMLDNSQPL